MGKGLAPDKAVWAFFFFPGFRSLQVLFFVSGCVITRKLVKAGFGVQYMDTAILIPENMINTPAISALSICSLLVMALPP